MWDWVERLFRSLGLGFPPPEPQALTLETPKGKQRADVGLESVARQEGSGRKTSELELSAIEKLANPLPNVLV
jgi:hypothetical protein